MGLPGSQQIIDRICKGLNKNCRKSVFKALASLLDVPEEWLSGEKALKYVPDAGLIAPSGPPYILEYRSSTTDHPALAQLACHRFLSKANVALKRDLRCANTALAKERRESWGDVLLLTLLWFAWPPRWQSALLVEPSRQKQFPEDIDPTLLTGFQRILEPWFRGDAVLKLGPAIAWREANGETPENLKLLREAQAVFAELADRQIPHQKRNPVSEKRNKR